MSLWSTIIELFANTASGKKAEPPLIKPGTQIYTNEIIDEARKWIGLDENGPGVNSFRMAVDQKAGGEAWCAAFVMYCARAVSLRHGREPALYPSELCSEIWIKTPKSCRTELPQAGCIVLWNRHGTIHGHTGIIEKVLSDGSFYTIEGNTGNGSGVHGVHQKLRTIKSFDGMTVLGFLKPFG